VTGSVWSAKSRESRNQRKARRRRGFTALGVVYAREDPARAVRLLGRADALREETAFRNDDPVEQRLRDEAEAELRARLGEDAYAAAYAEACALPLEDALALALRRD
jgi:hypothetical protein